MKKIVPSKILLYSTIAAILLTPALFWGLRAEGTARPAPLFDRELFSGNPEMANAQVSPSGSHLAYLRPYHNCLNIWIKKIDDPFSASYPVTFGDNRPLSRYRWSKDGKYLLFFSDEGGKEDFHLHAIDPFDAALEVRDLTPYDSVRVQLLCLPKDSPNDVYVGLNDRDARYHDVYRINLTTGERTLLQQNDDEIADWIFDRAGNLRIALKAMPDGSTQLYTVYDGKLLPLWSCARGENVEPYCFHKDGKRLYMASNKGSDVDLMRFMLLNVETGEEEQIESDPENEVDFCTPLFSKSTEELTATMYVGDRQRVYFRNKEWERDFQTLQEALPDGELDIVSSTEDDSVWIVAVRSDIDPETAYLFNRDSKKTTFLYKSRPNLPSEYLCTMKPITYATRDGLTIHAYLTLPKGITARNLPFVIFPHGGPWARNTWEYDGMVQYLANRGYAVLQMNFRGSTGYGKKFLQAGNKQWGDAMQDDITDGVMYLIDQGIVDPKRVAIFGASYGGYATLAGLAFTPNLYAAGVSYVGPSNLITLLNSFPPYWESTRSFMDERLGNTSNPDDITRLTRQSPLFSAQNITAPLLVVQGANDPRVKKAESDQIVIALRSLGRPVEYIVAPDEGHGFACRENRLAFAVALEKFLAAHLGGKYQEDVPEQTKERLKEISVDVQSLALPPSEGLEDLQPK